MKPTVKFKDVNRFTQVGFITLVFPIDHTSDDVSNTKWAITSPVVSVTIQDKQIVEFETENTRYIRQDEAEPTCQNCH